jgi:TRAP-type C4-dicarboxylate transport system permease small subunit
MGVSISKESNKMKLKIPEPLARVFILIDKIIEGISIALMTSMIILVFVKVLFRKMFGFFPSSDFIKQINSTLFWSDQMTMLFLTWFTFIGIAIGFREKLHLAMDMIENMVPKTVIVILDKVILVSTFLFGLYMFYFGGSLTIQMIDSTLATTKLSNAWQYVVIPLTGGMCCVYSVLQFFDIDTRRYTEVEDEITKFEKDSEKGIKS